MMHKSSAMLEPGCILHRRSTRHRPLLLGGGRWGVSQAAQYWDWRVQAGAGCRPQLHGAAVARGRDADAGGSARGGGRGGAVAGLGSWFVEGFQGARHELVVGGGQDWVPVEDIESERMRGACVRGVGWYSRCVRFLIWFHRACNCLAVCPGKHRQRSSHLRLSFLPPSCESTWAGFRNWILQLQFHLICFLH
jgi:hypothetical protein